MNKRVRTLFEEKVYPSFPGLAHGLRRKDNGEYVSGTLEDHWQTFQEGVELAVRECIAVHIDDYGVDIIGDALKKHFGVEE